MPLLAIIAYRLPKIGIMLGILMIIGNILLNMHYTYKYNLQIGLLSPHNYMLLQTIIARPWTKIQNVAQGVFTAMILRRIM